MNPKVIFLILFPLFAFSQSPQKINFQSILRNSNGEVVSDQTVSLKISILSGSISGSSVYGETHTKTTDASGLISLQIGSGTVLSGVFGSIDWGDAPHFIKLEADFSGGNNYVVLGTQELMSVPYALYASKTDTSSLNLVNRFAEKVNVSDTSNMLSNYLKKSEQITLFQSSITNLQNNLTLIDIDNNIYNLIQIGNQIWMKENLKVSRYRNGDLIQTNLNDADWSTDNIGAFGIYYNWPTNNIGYGKLYNFFAVSNANGICPLGWKVPTLEDMNILGVYGGEQLKQAFGWLGNQQRGNNISGFSANGGGRRWDYGFYDELNSSGYFWTSTEIDGNNAKAMTLNYGGGATGTSDYDKNNGFSVRCLKE
jgi:uncharacterized protein (TIGR02145 family)